MRHWGWTARATLQHGTWYSAPADGTLHFTLAGYWYMLVSMPTARFLLLRWYFRLFIWYSVAWQISRLPLRMMPMHPDRCGGIGFLGRSMDAFAPVFVAQTAFLSGVIGNEIWHNGATLPQFKMLILGVGVTLLVIALLPLTFFAPLLADARRKGLRDYGLLAARYVRDFREKWIDSPQKSENDVLGSNDIQSLSDLASSYDVVGQMGLLPFGKKDVIRLVCLMAVPLLPLTLTMIPFEEIVQRLLNMVL